jgi:hypothetical protein
VRIIIAVDSSENSSEDLDLPDRCRVVKLANSVTYDRWVSFCDMFLKYLCVSGWTKPLTHLRKSPSVAVTKYIL